MPRDWPPLSVGLLAVPLVGLPAALAVVAPANGLPTWPGLGLLLPGWVAVVATVRREPAGPVLAAVGAGLVGLLAGLLLPAFLTADRWREAAGCGAALLWAGLVLGAALWPDTRRWCDLLPARRPDADD